MMSGVLGKGFIGSYTTLQAFLRTNYYNDLADMRSAIEKTVGSDAAKRAQLGGKLNLLVTALHILDHPVAEASQEEYNALIHLGERVKSAVDLYRAQKASRAARRAATGASSGPVLPAPAPQLQQPPLAAVQQPQQPQPQQAQQAAEPFWEMPLEHISSIIAEERKRLPPVPELAALPPAAPSAQQPLPAAPEAQRVNPFMQQALAIAQGLPYAGASPDSSINVPPLRAQSSAPLADQGQRGFASLDLGAFGRPNRSWADPGSARAAAGAGAGVALAYSSGFYSMGAMPPGRAPAGAARPTHKRPAAALGAEDAGGEGGCGLGSGAVGRRASASGGAGGGAGGPENGRTTKYRSVSFDQPSRLRSLHSCPEAEFSFWGTAEGPMLSQCRSCSQGPLLGGAATPTAAGALPQAAGAPDVSISPFVQLAVQQQTAGAPPFFPSVPQSQQQQQQPTGAQPAAAVQHQQQALQQGLLRHGSASLQGIRQPSSGPGQSSPGLGPSPSQASAGMSLPPPSLSGLAFSSQQVPPGLPTGRPLDLGGGASQQFPSEALLQQRQRQWHQLLALRLQQQQATVPDAAVAQAAAPPPPPPQLPPHPYGMAGGEAWPEQRHSTGDADLSSGPAGLSAAQMILQGLPPEPGPAEASAALGAGAGDTPAGPPHAGNGPGRLGAGASPLLDPSKRSKHDSALSQSSPASHSTTGSGVSRCSNGAMHGPAAGSCDLAMPQATGSEGGGGGGGGGGSSSGASGELPPPPLTRNMSDGAGLSIATARLHLNSSWGQEPKLSRDASMGLSEEMPGGAGHAMSEQEKQGWEQLLMQAGAGGAATHKALTPSPPPGLFQQQQQQQQQKQLLQAKRHGPLQLSDPGMAAAAAAAAPALGGGSFLDFMGGQPMDLGHPGKQPSAACEALLTSGLTPLTSSTFDALATHLQPGQQQAQHAQQAAGAAAAGAAALRHSAQQLSPTAAEQTQQQQAQQAAPVPAFDAGGASGGGGSGAGEPQLHELGNGSGVPPPPPGSIPLVPSLPSMFALGSAHNGRASSEPSSEAAAMMQAPSLPLNPLDVNRFDSLLFELGPDFLPDFDATAGL